MKSTGCIHEHVDRSPAIDDCFHHPGHRFGEGDIRLQRHRFAARSFDLARHALCFGRVHVDDRNGGAFARESFRDRFADSLSPCGYDHDGAVQPS